MDVTETGNGADSASVVNRVRQLEARQREVREELAGLEPVPRLPAAVVVDCLGQWRRMLRQSTTHGRAVFQRLLRGRITLTPVSRRGVLVGYKFEAETRLDRLFKGVLAPPPFPSFVKPGDSRGMDGIQEEIDEDYGRVLERASNG